MLQAQIDIVDADGNTEESVDLVGAGRVSVARGLAAVENDGMHVSVRVGHADAVGRMDPATLVGMIAASGAFETMIVAIARLIRVRVTQTSDFRRWADDISAATADKVNAELAQLRAEGKIDEHGNLLVPLPPDMQPGSRTDV